MTTGAPPAGSPPQRSRRLRWIVAGVVAVLAATFCWALFADDPPDPVWVLDEPRTGARPRACLAPDGEPLPGGWYLFPSGADADAPEWHMHLPDPEDGPRLVKRIHKLLGRAVRAWDCAHYDATGVERVTESGRWIELHRTGPVEIAE